MVVVVVVVEVVVVVLVVVGAGVVVCLAVEDVGGLVVRLVLTTGLLVDVRRSRILLGFDVELVDVVAL